MNDSRYNTGRRVLPPVQQPQVYYSYDASALFPELETGGIGPMAGPAYDYSSRNRSRFKWPRAFEGKPLFYEWTRDYIKAFSLTHGEVTSIEDVAPDIVFDNPMDMEFGPDGALYVLEYGDGFFSENPEAQLARIDWTRGNRTPVPVVAADVVAGLSPLTVQFSSAGTADADGDALRYAWDFDADGRVDSRAQNPSFTYTEDGVYEATLIVTDSTGRRAWASVQIVVGNTIPVVTLTAEPAGGTFQFGDAGHLHGDGRGRRADRLRAGHRGLHPRTRRARASAHLDGGLLGHDPDVRGHRARRREQPARRLRRQLHGRAGGRAAAAQRVGRGGADAHCRDGLRTEAGRRPHGRRPVPSGAHRSDSRSR